MYAGSQLYSPANCYGLPVYCHLPQGGILLTCWRPGGDLCWSTFVYCDCSILNWNITSPNTNILRTLGSFAHHVPTTSPLMCNITFVCPEWVREFYSVWQTWMVLFTCKHTSQFTPKEVQHRNLNQPIEWNSTLTPTHYTSALEIHIILFFCSLAASVQSARHVCSTWHSFQHLLLLSPHSRPKCHEHSSRCYTKPWNILSSV